ncbi:hypothetical protein EMIHUDRAFT_458474 [Emiliania huxleyi CCMP1516]|uniref:WWE domain-containing protein n=2 Tax=Emiliania huxleyi TaxID=2903 RepID=A0A0D3JBI4_EMIH1|nr:hypothetical protein EMIHUDRAFT_458474 [Emiliania huxleyi CCMP1516]EOD20869.1 hypothetical protein EMIHUDRAFT_458474 [Emiliania huxleyi CCMP1516]|eukprot:XP_005773298.1 hypothetical protein EMIHUDRAFT_458474 [Emiliania huxleyi CCMP1516]
MSQPDCTQLSQPDCTQLSQCTQRARSSSASPRATFTFVNESAHIALAGKPPPPPVSLCDGDVLRFGGGRQSSTRCDKFIFRVDAPQCKRAEGTVCLSPLPARASSAASSASAGETPLAEWFWQIGKGASRAWSRYAPHQEALIERAYQLAEERVRLDGERVLDLRQMKQVRDDGPGRSRPVRREPPAAPYSTRPTKRRRDARGATGGGEGGGGEGGGGEGGGGEGGGVATVRVLPNLSPAKRATVRVVVLRRDSGVVLTAGSGCLVSRDGHVLTAAHLFVSARSGALFHGFAPSEVLVAVGVYVDDAAPSRWAHTSIFVDSTHECLSREGQLLHTRAFIHAGSSGGPALTPSLHVVGVVSHNPRSSDDTIRPPEAGGEEYMCCEVSCGKNCVLDTRGL